jgi:hypothetical protein
MASGGSPQSKDPQNPEHLEASHDRMAPLEVDSDTTDDGRDHDDWLPPSTLHTPMAADGLPP